MHEARRTEKGSGEKSGMTDPRAGFAENDPGGIGRLPCYAVQGWDSDLAAGARTWPLSLQKTQNELRNLPFSG